MLTWVRKNLWSSYMFLWGILRKSSLPTTSKLPFSILKHVNQRRWWQYKVWAPSKSRIFDGAQSTPCWRESERTISSLTFWWGIWRKSASRTTSNLPLQVVKHQSERRWWLCKVWAPSKIIIFDGAQIDTVLTRLRKNYIEPNVLVRHLAHPNNMQASAASRKTFEPKKMVTLQSLGPMQN